MTEPRNDDDSQFKLPLDDDLIEPEIPTAVDELRLEKLNNRVTVISVLIPVLIVIVLVIAYLDIKKRVMHTEDTGTIGVQKLSTDLESRFSSLSVRQARIEDDVIRIMERLDQSVARIEGKLKQTGDTMGGFEQSLASKTELKRSSDDFDKKINNMSVSIEELQTQLAAWPQTIDNAVAQLQKGRNAVETQVKAMDAQLKAFEARVETITGKMDVLEKNKIEKPAMDLALRLEALKIENTLKAQIKELESKLDALETRLNRLPPPASTPAPAKPVSRIDKPAPAPAGGAGDVQEHPIPQ